ncbi:hypothetical protein [Paludisphaera mucosa]|uniref:PNPLA domain-containing protein n=1 Tax=Paludisphaera mucosa TaxID=3030827 RepID=A0ABT6FBY9_9BACT|nr:hypothetical protein [Paludisphaera mucosa]MDG3004969.1 hypothetical protein [Paludisphaera mucosa]
MADAAETTGGRPWRGDGWGFRMAAFAWVVMAVAPWYLGFVLSFASDGVKVDQGGPPKPSVDAQKLMSVARGGASAADSNLPTVARIFLDSQWTILVVVLGLTAVSTWRLYPILWRAVHTGLANYLLLLTVVFVLWMIYGGLSSMGMPGLFWSPERGDQFMAGLGVTLFMFWMLYLLFVSDYEAHREDPEHRAWGRLDHALRAFLPPALDRLVPESPTASVQMGWFVFFAAQPIVTMLALPAVLPSMRSGALQTVVARGWILGVAAAVATALVVVATRIPTRLNELRRQVLHRRLDFGQLWRLDNDRLDPQGNAKNMLIIVGILYLVAWVFPAATQRLFPPAFSLCILLGVLATFLVWLGMRQHWKSRAIAAAAILGLVAASGMLDYDVLVRDLAGGSPGGPDLYPTPLEQYRYHLSLSEAKPQTYARVVDLAAFQKERKLTEGRADFEARQKLLDRWQAGMRWGGSGSGSGPAGAGKPIVVVVTTSGGALRAGVWTQTVLRKLDEAFPGFHRHARLITGASGGMLGAARYVALHAEKAGDHVLQEGGRQPDFLGPIAWQIAFRDFLPNALTPFAVYNRGDKLEDVWREYAPELGKTFGDLAEKERAGAIPSIVFSPMLVEDGRRILIGNLPMADLTVHLNGVLLDESRDELMRRYLEGKPKNKDGRLKTAKDVDDYDLEYPALSSFSSMEFSKLFAEHQALDHLRLASAVRMSATFPFITSVVALPTFPARHVVDAGYYDNYGVNLASAWINSHRDWLRRNASGVLVVQVRAFRNEKRLKILDQEVYAPSKPQAEVEAGGVPLYDWVAWGVGLIPHVLTLLHDGAASLAIPAQGVAMARESSMFFRNDENLEVLHALFKRETGDDAFFRTVVFTCDTIQVGQASQNVETLNWYIDPVEYRQIERNMDGFDAASQTGRERNHLRLKRLKDWWRSRGGAVAPD